MRGVGGLDDYNLAYSGPPVNPYLAGISSDRMGVAYPPGTIAAPAASISPSSGAG